MTATDHLQPGQPMYHSTPSANRASIAKRGLQVDFANEPDDYFRGVYVTPTEPAGSPREDIWRVNTAGAHLHRDDYDNFNEFGGSYFSREDIPAHRLELHHQADREPGQ